MFCDKHALCMALVKRRLKIHEMSVFYSKGCKSIQ